MKIPELDHRTEADLMHRILSLAGSYTPEWKPNPDDPDVGMALAKLFAGMHCGTVQRLNRTAEKYHTAFCNFLGAGLMPSEPASGFVKFGLSTDQLENGVLVPAGTVLEADTESGTAVFTTQDDVLVSNAKPSVIVVTDGSHIRQAYNSETDGDTPDFILFGGQETDLNCHEVFIGCGTGLLNLIGESMVRLRLAGAAALERAWLDKQLSISYSTESGWEEFDNCLAEDDNTLRMTKRQSEPPAAPHTIGEQHCIWIRIQLETVQDAVSQRTDGISMMVSGNDVPPDVILTKNGTSDDGTFYPFDEQPELFDAVYIASDEALSKAGAEVTLQFTVSYAPLPEMPHKEKPVHGWKMVIRKSDVSIETPEIVTISSVAWEYFNGTGWKLLPCAPEMRYVFNPIEGSQTYTMTFICPEDVAPVIVEAEERRFIRARITKMEQSWQLNSVYRAPLMSHISIRYQCGSFVPADAVITHNQMQSFQYSGTDSFMMFYPMPDAEPVWYIGFSGKMQEGPYRMLIAIGQQSDTKMPALRWEYYDGSHWKPLSCYDETGQLAHTGFLTIAGAADLVPQPLFGKTLSWIRAVDVNAEYASPLQSRPHIERMDMNAVSIRNQQEMQPEYFSLSEETPFFSVKLSCGNISDVTVWVNECGLHGSGDVQEMLSSGIASAEYDNLGVLREFWVKYTSVESFAASRPEDRHYMIDRCEGVITFGDGRCGKIPCAGEGDRIRVCYSTGGGAFGNVPPGAVVRSQRALGLVTKIENPMPLYGGNDMELADAALRRTATEFRNGGLCVTARDYEDAACSIDRSILKVRCCTGCDAEGRQEAGSVTVIILRSDLTQESSGFFQTQAKLREELQKRRAASLSSGRLYVIHPKYIRICVNVRISTSDMSRMYRIKENVRQRIAEFIDPITGNFDGNGWRIGELPHRQQIENVVRSVSGVSYIEELVMRGFLLDTQDELDLDHIPAADFCIAVSGEHQVQTNVSV